MRAAGTDDDGNDPSSPLHEPRRDTSATLARWVVDGRSPGGGSSTAIVTATSGTDRHGRAYVVELYCPGPALLTRHQADELIGAIRVLLK